MSVGYTDSPLDVGALSRLVGMVYDCAFDPPRWHGALNAIRAELEFANAMLTVWRAPEGTTLLNVTSGIEAAYVESLPRHGSEIVAQWGGPHRINGYEVGEPAVLSRDRPHSLTADTAYRREWIEPQGLSDFMAVAITREADAYCSVGFATHESRGRIGGRAIDAVRLLAPHIRRAVAVSRMLDMQTVAPGGLGVMLETLSVCAMLVDTELRVLGANRAAAMLIERRLELRVERGAIALRDTAAQTALRTAVLRGGMGDAAMGRRGMGIPIGRVAYNARLLTVMPLGNSPYRSQLSPPATAVVFVAQQPGPAPSPAEALAALFDLTPAETRVFSSIASGRSVVETADLLGVNVSTARSHLLRLFEKTQTRRQAELVRLAHSFAIQVP